jgi:hypothetical protein
MMYNHHKVAAGGADISLCLHKVRGMKIYHKSEESKDEPSWICGHWNGSPLEIGTGLRLEVGAHEIRHHHPY